MYICDMCNKPIEAGTQYVKVFGKNICLDCAVRNTLDDIMSTFGIAYMEVPDEIFVSATVDGHAIDATPEQVENFFHSKNPVFAPTQVGEKNTVLTTLSACDTVWKRAWVYQSESDAKYWAEHYLKNIPTLVSIDGFVSEDDIPDDCEAYRADEYAEDGRLLEYKNAREASWTPDEDEEWRKKEAEMIAYIRQCDTMEQFIEKYPGMEDYWDAELNGK